MKRDSILIIEDSELNREMLVDILSQDYKKIYQAEDGLKGIEKIDQYSDSLIVILLDVFMPNCNGITVLKYASDQGITDFIPVIVITSDTSAKIEEECLKAGAFDFIRKPFNENLIRHKVKSAATLFNYKNDLELRVEQQTRELKHQNKKLTSLNDSLLELLGDIVEARDVESGDHIFRVKEITRVIAKQVQKDWPEYNLSKDDVNLIAASSVMHDIGKIAIPDSILLKTDKLTSEEFEIMKTHTTKGCEILIKAKHIWEPKYFECSYEICRHHHEKYDGKGYPMGLKGEEIPLEAQIVSIADVFDALVSKRVYKEKFGYDKNMIMDELQHS